MRTYFDPGKSALVLRTRQGLRQLLKDTLSGEPDFKAILVYDVSRWGRFQDADESAHYEFVCKSAGVRVHYCAETFVNDDTLASAIMKALKRTMAGEYSRELGVKVFDGQRRLAYLGFKQGGRAGYGLRRLLVSPSRQPKQKLGFGERKSISTDRVILVPGPVEEVDTVQEIYRLFVSQRLSLAAIARELNRRKIPCPNKQAEWNVWAVSSILSRPKYCGHNVYNRTSSRLYTSRLIVPESDWIVVPGAFQAVVNPETFAAAQQIFRNLTVHKSNEQLLQDLRHLLAREGRLSHTLVEKSPGMARVTTYTKRFGSLRNAYQLIGYGRPEHYGPVDDRCRTQAMREQLMQSLTSMFPEDLSVIRKSGRFNPMFLIEKAVTVSVIVAAFARTRNTGSSRWRIRPGRESSNLMTLIARLDESNLAFLDFHVFLRLDRSKEFYLRRDDSYLMSGVRLGDLQEFLVVLKKLLTIHPSIEASGS